MKIESKVIFGTEAVNRYEETGEVPSDKWLNQHGGVVTTQIFNSKPEYDAYLQGIADGEDWYARQILNPIITKTSDCSNCCLWRCVSGKGNHYHYCPVCGKQLNEKPQIRFESVTFQNRIYPTRTIDIPGYMDAAVISIEELNNLIRNSAGNDISPESEQLETIDNSIFFYVPKNKLGLPDKELAKLVINYLGGK